MNSHQLAVQEFLRHVFATGRVGLLREANRLQVPVGTAWDDQRLLVDAIASARTENQSLASAFYALHGVNNHAENLWRDYYLANDVRINKAVDAAIRAPSSSLSSPFKPTVGPRNAEAEADDETDTDDAKDELMSDDDGDDKAGRRQRSDPARTTAPRTRKPMNFIPVEEMGGPGTAYTLGDLRAVARYIVSRPELLSMPNKTRARELAACFERRTMQAWRRAWKGLSGKILELVEEYKVQRTNSAERADARPRHKRPRSPRPTNTPNKRSRPI